MKNQILRLNNSNNNNSQLDEQQYMIMNPKFSSLLGGIQHKMGQGPELGRILKDKGYDRVKCSETDFALRVHVRTEENAKLEKFK